MLTIICCSPQAVLRLVPLFQIVWGEMCPGRPSGGGAFTKLGEIAEFGEASAFHALLLGGVSPNDLEQPPVMPLSNTMHYSARPSSHLQLHIRQNFDSQC